MVEEVGEVDREKPRPVPESATVCGLPEAVSITASAPVLAPAAVGANVTLIVQPAPAGRELPQLLVWLKSPVAAIPAMLNGACPVLSKVTVWGGLGVPTSVVPKKRLAGDRLTAGTGGW
jgi:hypothetical protein